MNSDDLDYCQVLGAVPELSDRLAVMAPLPRQSTYRRLHALMDLGDTEARDLLAALSWLPMVLAGELDRAAGGRTAERVWELMRRIGVPTCMTHLE